MPMDDPYASPPQDLSPPVQFMLYGLRLYLACLVVVTAYTVFWFVGMVDLIEIATLGLVWVVITSMGAAFLIVLLPLFYLRQVSV